MSNSNISGGFQAYTLLLWHLIYDIFCLHILLFITVNMSLYTTGDFSSHPNLFISFSLLRILIHVEMNRSEYMLQRCLKVSSFIFTVNRLVIPTTKKRCGSFVNDAPLTSDICASICSVVQSILILEVIQNI